MSEWTPLDDLGRSEAAFLHHVRRSAAAAQRFTEARERALTSVNEMLEALSCGEVDWTVASDDEVREMGEALDTIYRVRGLLEDLG